jgi:hypothetical protein
MGTPTLGYEGSTTLLKSEIAEVQLSAAIDLFVAEKFLPAITLTGAAEEIFGKLLVRRSALPVVKESAQAIEQLRERTGLSVMSGKPEKALIDDWNAARNNAKHLIGAEDEPVTLNLCDEAYWMIRRALENAKKLGVRIPNYDDLDNWMIVNVNT